MRSLIPPYDRRSFLRTGILASSSALLSTTNASIHPRMAKDDISLAQWALVDEIRNGKLNTLDFPKTARQDFDLNAVELVNTLFEVPTQKYLAKLRKNASNHGVKIILIMVDQEGNPDTPSKRQREEFVTGHRRWIDIAQYLGCHAIRTNCRGSNIKEGNVDKKEMLNWAAESYHHLLEHAQAANIRVTIENHGGISNDPDWIVQLMQRVNSPYLGTYPDWRSTDYKDFDTIDYLKKTAPYAFGQSYRNQPTEEDALKLLQISKASGYRGWYGIESSGREAINQGITFLKKHL